MDEEEPRAAPIKPIALPRLSKGQQYMVSVTQTTRTISSTISALMERKNMVNKLLIP